MSGALAQALRVSTLDDVVTQPALSGLDGTSLLSYLKKQRWFGAKGTADDARVVDVIPLPWDGKRLGIAIIEVTGGGTTARYQLPISVRRVDAQSLAEADASAAIAPVEGVDGSATLIDATQDPVFQRELGAAFNNVASFASPAGNHWCVETVRELPIRFPKDGKVTLGSGEQSNTSLIYDGRAFLKLFRKIEAGIHPDVEMTRFLSIEAKFANVPGLLGIVTYRDGGGEAVTGMLQEYLPGSKDAWSHVLASARSKTIMHELEQLGTVTREMHEALAGEEAEAAGSAFMPLAAESSDVERWAQQAKESIRGAIGLLEKQRSAGALSVDRATEADVLIRRREHYLNSVEEIADMIGDDAGARIRTHGDYHLGQVLRTASGSFVVIDFEGEPTRPLADRREKTSALRDVAGMLRSLSYAAATMVQSKPSDASDRRQMAERELAAGRWERDARAAFLRGYTGVDAEEQGLLPADPAHLDALLSLFETEKVFYELSYELNHRPGWEWIPMRGISQLLRAR